MVIVVVEFVVLSNGVAIAVVAVQVLAHLNVSPAILVYALLQQILGHLYLLRRARDGDDTIVRVWQGLVDGDVRTGLVADATDAATSLTNDGTSQLFWNGDLCAVVGIMTLRHICRGIWAAIRPTVSSTDSIKAGSISTTQGSNATISTATQSVTQSTGSAWILTKAAQAGQAASATLVLAEAT